MSEKYKNYNISSMPSKMTVKPFTLKFSGNCSKFENAFLESYFIKSLPQLRIALFLAMLFYAAFGILDIVLVPDKQLELWFIRYYVVCPLCFSIVLFSFSKKFKKYMQASIALMTIVAGLGIIVMIVIAPPPANFSYYAGLILVFMFGYTIIRSLFIWATLGGWVIIVLYEIAAMYMDTPITIFINNNFFFISANLIGMFACYLIEYYERKDFFMTCMLENEREKVNAANRCLEKRVEERTEQIAKTNKALQESEEKYRTILETIEEGYYEVDVSGNFIFFNDSICRILGYSENELTEMNYKKLADPENTEKIYKIFRNLYKTKQPVKLIDYEIIKKDGNKRILEVSVNLMRNKKGRPTLFRGIARDISKQKQLEAQLHHSQKMEAVGTLAGGIAHDFNNILQAISGYTQLLLMRKDKDDPDYDKLTMIDKSTFSASELTKRLLIFSRKVKSELKPLNINHEIEYIAKLLKRTIPKMISVKLELEKNTRSINADSLQLEQIFMNMGVNARDAMPNGGILTFKTENVTLDEEYCKTHVGSSTGEHVLLTIADTGHGMDKKTIDHIFEPFFTTKEMGKGTGLGLATVYGIVKNHNAYITCHSKQNIGTNFKIYFPAIQTEPEKQKSSEMKKIQGGNETILLVDDEEFLLELSRETLQQYGYSTIKARCGEDAVDIYKTEHDRIDLTLLDINMPGMGGYKCLQELLKINPNAKIVMVSGHSPEKNKALISKAVGFITKPYNLMNMLKEIRHILDEDITTVYNK